MSAVLKNAEVAAWPEVPLTEIADLIRGVSYPKTDARDDPAEGFVPVLRATNIQDARLVLESDLVHIAARNVSSEQRLRKGDIVVATSSGSKHLVGKSAQLHGDWRGSFGAFCAAIRPRAHVESRYLALFLQSPGYWKQVTKKALGVNINNLRRGDLETLLVPLPPVGVQQCIVAEIEKQFSRLDEAVANLKRVKANLKRYKAAVLKAAVEGRLVQSDGEWAQIKLGEVATSIRNGYSKKPDAEAGTRIFRISAVRPLELDVNDVRYLSGPQSEYAGFMVEAGDVLFTRYNGSRDYVGVCALVRPGIAPTAYPDKLIRVRVPADTLHPKYLVIAASAGKAREYIESKIRTTAGQSGISGGDLKSLPLAVPRIAEQLRIVAEVDRWLSLACEIDVQVKANLIRIERLRQSTLTRAFFNT